MQRHLLLTLLALVVGCAQGGTKSDASSGDGSTPHSDAGPRPDAPPGTEICDGQDNDGDQFIDEGTPEELCGTVENGTPECNGLLGCQIGSCDTGWYDVDGEFDTGCECQLETQETNDNLCTSAIDLGDFPDSNTSVEVVGKIVPESDEDYYKFQAIDSADTSCDTFHVRVMFLENPDNQFVIDVWRNGCDAEQVCSGGTDMQWYTNFNDGSKGECPCGPTTLPHCSDDSASFHVRVRRKEGVPITCDEYKLEISNGKYPAP